MNLVTQVLAHKKLLMQAIGIVSLKNSSSWFTENVKLKIIGPLEFMCWLRSGFNVCFICRSNALSALFVIHDANFPSILFCSAHVWWNAAIPFSLTTIMFGYGRMGMGLNGTIMFDVLRMCIIYVYPPSSSFWTCQGIMIKF